MEKIDQKCSQFKQDCKKNCIISPKSNVVNKRLIYSPVKTANKKTHTSDSFDYLDTTCHAFTTSTPKKVTRSCLDMSSALLSDTSKNSSSLLDAFGCMKLNSNESDLLCASVSPNIVTNTPVKKQAPLSGIVDHGYSKKSKIPTAIKGKGLHKHLCAPPVNSDHIYSFSNSNNKVINPLLKTICDEFKKLRFNKHDNYLSACEKETL